MVSGAFLSLTKIISSIRILIVCTSCKTSYNVLSHSYWGLGQFVGGWGWGWGVVEIPGGGVKKRQKERGWHVCHLIILITFVSTLDCVVILLEEN